MERVEFFASRTFIRNEWVWEIDVFNTFDFLVVAIWAVLYLDEKMSPHPADGSTRNIVLWLRLLRCTKAIAMVSRVVKHVFRPPRPAEGHIRRDSTGIIFLYLCLTDTRLLVLLLYVLASTFGMVRPSILFSCATRTPKPDGRC